MNRPGMMRRSPSSARREWTCSACTYRNHDYSSNNTCSMCGTAYQPNHSNHNAMTQRSFSDMSALESISNSERTSNSSYEQTPRLKTTSRASLMKHPSQRGMLDDVAEEFSPLKPFEKQRNGSDHGSTHRYRHDDDISRQLQALEEQQEYHDVVTYPAPRIVDEYNHSKPGAYHESPRTSSSRRRSSRRVLSHDDECHYSSPRQQQDRCSMIRSNNHDSPQYASPQRHSSRHVTVVNHNEEENGWECQMCTFHNDNPLFLVCLVCGHARDHNNSASPLSSSTPRRGMPSQRSNSSSYSSSRSNDGHASMRSPSSSFRNDMQQDHLAYMRRQRERQAEQDEKMVQKARWEELIAMQRELLEDFTSNNAETTVR